KNSPKKPKYAAVGVVNHKAIIPINAINVAMIITTYGFISPVTVCLPLFLSIIASISFSYKLLKSPSIAITKCDTIKASNISSHLSKIPIRCVYIERVRPANIGIKFEVIMPVLIVWLNISYLDGLLDEFFITYFILLYIITL